MHHTPPCMHEFFEILIKLRCVPLAVFVSHTQLCVHEIRTHAGDPLQQRVVKEGVVSVARQPGRGRGNHSAVSPRGILSDRVRGRSSESLAK